MRYVSSFMLAGLFATGMLGGGTASGQENPENSEEAVDYSDDPSLTAARDFLAVINELNRQSQGDDAEEKRGPVSNEPWPLPPSIGGWDSHFLVLQGENYLPVREAFATPAVTLFALEEGYLPSGPLSAVDEDDACTDNQHKGTGQGGGRTNGGLDAASATAVEAAGTRTSDWKKISCPQRVGLVWGSGSYVYDKDWQQLAGQDFSDNVKAFRAHDPFASDNADDVLVIVEGGPARVQDPAIIPLPFSRGLILDYPVLLRGGSVETDPSGEPYVAPAPELPIMLDPTVILNRDGTEEIGMVPLDPLLEAIEDAIEKASQEGEVEAARARYLLIHRGDPDLPEETVGDRLKKIRERIRASASVKTLSFGQEAPLCSDDSSECWSLNRSSILYRLP
ncbi:MAG: hypothetical protein MRY64_01880 [Hyphomonadaceae bacterium]|nr:hypothetical protein [Hyphomonadaceae bacterium]